MKILYFDDFKLGVLNKAGAVVDVSQEVLRELGVASQQIAELRGKGVI